LAILTAGLLLIDYHSGLAASLSLVAWLLVASEKNRAVALVGLSFVAIFGIGYKFGWTFGQGSPYSSTKGIFLSPVEMAVWVLGSFALVRKVKKGGLFQTSVLAAMGWLFLVLVAAGIGISLNHPLRSVVMDFRALTWIMAFFVLVDLTKSERNYFWNVLALAVVARVARDLLIWFLEPGAFYTGPLPWTMPMYIHSDPLQFAMLAIVFALWFKPEIFKEWKPGYKVGFSSLLLALMACSLLRSYWVIGILATASAFLLNVGKESLPQMRRIAISICIGIGGTLLWAQSLAPDFAYFGIKRFLSITQVIPGTIGPDDIPAEDWWFDVSPQLINFGKLNRSKMNYVHSPELSEIVKPAGVDRSLIGRWSLVRAALKIFKEKPWTGQGLGGVYKAKYHPALPNPHNAYAWSMGTMGIPGIFYTLALIGAVFVAFYRSRVSRDQGSWNLAAARRIFRKPTSFSAFFMAAKFQAQRCWLFPKIASTTERKPWALSSVPKPVASSKRSAAAGPPLLYSFTAVSRSGNTRRNVPPGRSKLYVCFNARRQSLRERCSSTCEQ